MSFARRQSKFGSFNAHFKEKESSSRHRTQPFNFDMFQKYNLDEQIRIESSNSKFDVIVMAMHFAMRHSLTNVATEDLLNMINVILGYKAVLDTKHKLDKLFYCNNEFQYHYYCQKCSAYIGESKDSESIDHCSNPVCLEPFSSKNKNNGHYFIYIPIEPQIRQILESDGIFEKIVNVDQRKVDDDMIRDIFDGLIYKELIKSGVLSPKTTLTLTTGIDSSPVFKALKNSLCPIQFRLNELIPSERLSPHRLLTAGLWFGSSEPVMNTFLVPVIKDAHKLEKVGVNWTHSASGTQICTKVLTICCITDSVGKPKVQNVIQFNGHFGCPYCLHPGQAINRVVKYLVETYRERTNLSLRSDMWEAMETNEIVNGAKGLCLFCALCNFNAVWGFPIDYMHGGLLGVMRFLFSLWFDSTTDKPYHVKKADQVEINKILLSIRPPSNISRMPRPLFDSLHWKASEWRSFLLLYCFVCLYGFLDTKYFDHFCLFASGLYILLQDEISKDDIALADFYLNAFVDQFADLYGEESMRFNVHLLTHLARNVYLWGPLWATSAFSLETGNGNLVELINGTRAVVDQIARKVIIFANISSAVCDNFLHNPAAADFCSTLMSFERLKVSSNCGSATVVGAFSDKRLDEDEKEALGKFGQERVEIVHCCNKIIYNGFILAKDKGDTKFNDSLVKLVNGEYCKILYFIMNPKDENSLLFLGKKLNLSVERPTGGQAVMRHIKACEFVAFQNFSIHRVESIKCKSILMMSKTSGLNYVSDFPNFFEKD